MSSIPAIMNNSIRLSDLKTNTMQGGGTCKDKQTQTLTKRFENLGIPVGFLSTSRKNKPRKLPDVKEGEGEPIITDKMMNYFINKALP